MTLLARAAGLLSGLSQPLGLCVLLVVGLALCLYLFLTLKREICALGGRCEDGGARIDTLETSLAGARQEVETLAGDLHLVERQTGMLVAPAPALSGLNLSRRTQVLRLHRAGQDNAGIAAALALPKAEVDLLIKVHRMAVERT